MGETIDRVLATDVINHEGLREACREAMYEDKCSQIALARQAQIGDSTFSAWLKGAYAGDNEKVAHKVRMFLDSRRSRQVTKATVPVAASFVMTASAQAYLGLLQRAHYEPTMITLTGRPGVGKTEAVREYRRRTSGVYVLTATRSVSSPYAVLDCLCDVMNISEGNPARRARVIRQALRLIDALIIVDEAQHLKMEAIDELRSFHDDADGRVGIALVGSPDLRTRMLAGGKRGAYAQLTSRFGAHIVRPKPLASDVVSLLDAEGVEDAEARGLLRAVAGEPGALREMKFVLRAARMISAEDGAAQITAAHVTRAHEQRRAEIAEAS